MESFFHKMKLRFSPQYRAEHGLARLRDLVALYAHCTANKAVLHEAVVACGRHGRTAAARVLAEANNFDCKELGVSIDPSLGRLCGDQVMETAREHLKLVGCRDRATWARKRLLLAKRWYTAARALTPELDREIEWGLIKTAWVG